MHTFFIEHSYLIGLVSFALGWMGMPVVIRIAKAKGFVVRPNKRMSHTGEVPNIGGLDIYFSVMLSYLLFDYSQVAHNQFFMIGIAAIMAVGFIDDVLVLNPLSKLLGETLAGVALIGFSDLRITHLHGLFGIEGIGVIPSYLISLFILVAIINAINLIDGIDGLASGLGILYCLFFAIYFHLVGSTSWSILAICMIGALAVFFIFNVFGNREKIFMGDSGSLLLGYLLTAFVFRFCEQNAHHVVPEIYHMSAAPAVAICVLTVPIFDTIRVSLTRIKHHCSPFKPDKNHIHHLLLRTGLNHIQTTCVLLSVSVVFIGLAILGRNWNMWLLLFADFALATVMTLILWRVINKKISTGDVND
ncbi:MAG: undecaprenyl/decaprenyl-phosphate alpha-N-acetylglucosaminyl 1-phosphate transferase [Paludibacteraceae bacterium]|nr:undecaprenyl/decaprenyl-phosphate alpha-N-acetylglucosaminyl 1-phosphate transferase [Paludibacteraceae bacterium]MBQ2520294.1 undecaprenyl/decaprenyl-phosphate alpha-N-acetylglucosaminyl 1-phosphate transferase [Paludibacteraceae bacterium]MBQ5378826.1 undecaprenyl/decaprenyl-phosphate alpha-N-acetylglucosaminyl 1-phosphate transferase [Paludibacteraceae bacterium]